MSSTCTCVREPAGRAYARDRYALLICPSCTKAYAPAPATTTHATTPRLILKWLGEPQLAVGLTMSLNAVFFVLLDVMDTSHALRSSIPPEYVIFEHSGVLLCYAMLFVSVTAGLVTLAFWSMHKCDENAIYRLPSPMNWRLFKGRAVSLPHERAVAAAWTKAEQFRISRISRKLTCSDNVHDAFHRIVWFCIVIVLLPVGRLVAVFGGLQMLLTVCFCRYSSILWNAEEISGTPVSNGQQAVYSVSSLEDDVEESSQSRLESPSRGPPPPSENELSTNGITVHE